MSSSDVDAKDPSSGSTLPKRTPDVPSPSEMQCIFQCRSAKAYRMTRFDDQDPVLLADGRMDILNTEYNEAVENVPNHFTFISIAEFVLPLLNDVNVYRDTNPASYVFLAGETEGLAMYRIVLLGAESTELKMLEDILGSHSHFLASSQVPGGIGEQKQEAVNLVRGPSQEHVYPASSSVDDYRNQMILVGENGEVVGALDKDVRLVVEDDSKSIIAQEGAPGSGDHVVLSLESTAGAGAVHHELSDPWIQRVNYAAAKANELIKWGALKLNSAIESQGEAYKAKTTPDERPTEIKEGTKATFQAAESVTGSAVRLTGKVVEMVGKAGSVVASKITEHERKNAESRDAAQPETRWEAAKRLAGHSVLALARVAETFDTETKVVLKKGASTTVDVVHHRKGEDAGRLAESATRSLRNAAVVFIDAKGLTHKAILKTVAITSAKQVASSGKSVTR